MKKVYLILLVLLSIINVKAYENKYFEINIPSDFEKEETTENVYKWSNKNKYISIVIVDNITSQNISKLNDKDIQKEKESMLKTYNSTLNNYKTEATIDNMKKEIINDKTVLLYDIFIPTKDNIGFDTYQKGLTSTTNNYIITLIYSSDIEIDNDYFNNLVRTFKIYDKEKNNTPIIVFTILFTISIVGAIIYYFKRKKHE